MDLIASCINRAHAETTGVTVVLENVAGQVCGKSSLDAPRDKNPGNCLIAAVVLVMPRSTGIRTQRAHFCRIEVAFPQAFAMRPQ